MTRTRADIMRDLQAIVAELAYVYGDDTAGTGDSDLSPKLAQALASPPIKSHEEIRQQARAYKPTDYSSEIQPDEVNRPERKERLADYTPAHDPDWDEAVFLGTGDHRPD